MVSAVGPRSRESGQHAQRQYSERSQNHPCESTSAMTANDEELGRLGLIKKMTGRIIPHDAGMNGDVRVAFPPSRPAAQTGLYSRSIAAPTIPGSTRLINPGSLQACMATKSTPRQDASSKAIAVASSEAGDPSIPTTTRRLESFGLVGATSLITATGQCACRERCTGRHCQGFQLLSGNWPASQYHAPQSG